MGYFLDFHKKSIKRNRLPDWGLCGSFKTTESKNMLEELFEPQNPKGTDYQQAFWASGLNADAKNDEHIYDYTPLRQTIVLFLAAINNEL